MEITQQQINAAYQVADENQKKVLDALFGKQEPVDNRPVTERIKTFEDACNELSRRAENGDELAGDILCDYESNNCKGADITAYLKLRIIVAALNEGWEPQFVEGERLARTGFRARVLLACPADQECSRRVRGGDPGLLLASCSR